MRCVRWPRETALMQLNAAFAAVCARKALDLCDTFTIKSRNYFRDRLKNFAITSTKLIVNNLRNAIFYNIQ